MVLLGPILNNKVGFLGTEELWFIFTEGLKPCTLDAVMP